MNQSELAGLIAHNPPFTGSSPIMSQKMHSSTPPSPISPRARFEQSIRALQHKQHKQQPVHTDNDRSRHRRQRSELELVSSLRVTHRRTRSAQPAPRDPPDFSRLEREAWASASPETRPRIQDRPMSQLRGQPQARTLRPFEPLHTIVDVEERPKTSRGQHGFEIAEDSIPEERVEPTGEEEGRNEEDEEGRHLSAVLIQPGRASKFIEGSMNQRCSGTASSWSQDGSVNSNKPLPPTPVAKHVTFSCTPVRESVDDKTMRPGGALTKKRERKGLRKSLSNFNLQALSEKVKIFGGGSNSLFHPENVEKQKCSKQDDGTNILHERKRKAEEAYATRFGFKKQRFSDPSGLAAPSPNVGAYNSSSFKDPASAAPTAMGLSRKQSRRDLELENAELWARLAQQQNQYHKPNLHYPVNTQHGSVLDEQPTTVAPSRKRRRQSLDNIPPLPKLPRGGGILHNVENNSQRRMVSMSADGAQGDTFNAAREKDKDQNTHHQPIWEWPEDVF